MNDISELFADNERLLLDLAVSAHNLLAATADYTPPSTLNRMQAQALKRARKVIPNTVHLHNRGHITDQDAEKLLGHAIWSADDMLYGLDQGPVASGWHKDPDTRQTVAAHGVATTQDVLRLQGQIPIHPAYREMERHYLDIVNDTFREQYAKPHPWIRAE